MSDFDKHVSECKRCRESTCNPCATAQHLLREAKRDLLEREGAQEAIDLFFTLAEAKKGRK